MFKLCIGIIALLIVGVLSFTASRLSALQDNPQPTTAEQVADGFWKTWEGVRPSEAVQKAWPEQREWDAIGRAADDFQSNAIGGKCLGHSEVARKALGPNVQYISYYAIYQPTPLRVEMLCYKAADQWNIIALHVDANPQHWLTQANQQQFGSGTDGNANAGQQ